MLILFINITKNIFNILHFYFLFKLLQLKPTKQNFNWNFSNCGLRV